MAAGIRGRLVSAAFATTMLHRLPGADAPSDLVITALEAWAERCDALLGPASSLRAIADTAVVPLLKILGFTVERRVDQGAAVWLNAVASPGAGVPVVVVAWNASLERTWRELVVQGVLADARWCFCCNGSALRIVDGHRTWSRQHLEFDLALASRDMSVRTMLWALTRADAMSQQPTVLDRASDLSARYGVAVCKALGVGVLAAINLLMAGLAERGDGARKLFEQSLTVMYRVLFLLFAEARALVPMWHPVYRDRYSIDSIVTALLEGRRCRGIWHAVLAISRMAHSGCSAGELKVTAFNGRLFAPADSATFDRRAIDDRTMGAAILAIGSTSGSDGRARISYEDLDVEQIGAVYERVLDYEPDTAGTPRLMRSGDTRRSTSSFYTPRSVTAFLVRRTLEPLVRDRTSDEILQLRVLDPAMGSGAFLVAACRFLASAVEERLVLEGRWHAGDAGPAERSALRRDIAQRCLFGVDLNPMAVQLGRLSLWLASLASDKPLTFLDHHLVPGNSLVGATLESVWQQSMPGHRRRKPADRLSLFNDLTAIPVLREAVRARLSLTTKPDDSADIVHGKEKTLAALHAPPSPLGRWTALLDLWCACWFWDDGVPPDAALFKELADRLLGVPTTLPAHSTGRFLDQAASVAARHRFLHWQLAFPEVFLDELGHQRADAGFDAVVGNPPWDMIRGDSGDGDIRAGRRKDARQFSAFARDAGLYRIENRGHVNRYQLFVERALQLARQGGRIGLVLPSGAMTDVGAAPLRRYLFDHAEIDMLTGLDNRAGIFQIHRSLRFALLTATTGQPTGDIACRFGVAQADDLDNPEACRPLTITRALLDKLSGSEDLGIPEFTTARDLQILEALASRFPCLGAASGWNVHFGRELNATDDSAAFVPLAGHANARPVLEGKQIEPFRISTLGCQHGWVDAATRRVPRRARLAYRDIASATNRLTLIAAIVPAHVVTTHTLFCLKSRLPSDHQYVLCALLNSFVANYLIRMRVNTHVTAAHVSRLRVPPISQSQGIFGQLASLARALSEGTEPIDCMEEYFNLQALVAKAYEIGGEDLEHILGTFPLVAEEVRRATLLRFKSLTGRS